MRILTKLAALIADRHPSNDRQKAIRKMDHKLSLDVRRALSKTKGMVVKNIFVCARSGSITLSGSVPDAALISKAAEVVAGGP
jgi:hyperosmotically inducible protein